MTATAAEPNVIVPINERTLEQQWRAMSREEQPYLVVFFGMLDYSVISVHDTEADAEQALAAIAERVEAAERLRKEWVAMSHDERAERYPDRDTYRIPPEADRVSVKSMTRDASAHEFQVRQQWDLDDLVRAIHSC